MTLFIAHCISSTCFFLSERSVVNGTVNCFAFVYCYIILLFPLVCVQHSGPEIKWVDGGKQLLKISTHLVSTVYTQVSYKTNLENFLGIMYIYNMHTQYMGRFLNSVCSSLFYLVGFSHGLFLLHQM